MMWDITSEVVGKELRVDVKSPAGDDYGGICTLRAHDDQHRDAPLKNLYWSLVKVIEQWDNRTGAHTPIPELREALTSKLLTYGDF